MRIAQLVCSDGFAGVERHIATLSAVLAARGEEVVVVGGDPAPMRRILGSGVEYHSASSPAEAAHVLSRVAPADILGTHMTEADVVGARSARRHGGRVVSTRHFAAVRGGRRVVRPVLRWMLRDVAAQIAVSQFVADAVEGEAHVVHPGVANAEPGTRRDRTVLVAQRLEREKDTASALVAWSRTRAREDGWRLQVAGRGAEQARLEALARDLDIAETVDLLGFRTDVDDLMARAGMLLATAPDEHFGLSVVEAMARATPVVATATGGHLETVGSVEGAAMYPVGDPDAAARAIDALVADPDRRADLGVRLRRRQQEAFSADVSAAATLQVYERVLAA